MGNNETLKTQIKQATINWVQQEFRSQEVILGLVEPDEDEPERWLVDFAIPTIPYWQVAEVWIEDDQIVNITDLGEGVPPEGMDWPWSAN
ncbi:MAG: hypothetical protein KA314_26380 [Chloroflexi bacterium]|nr:hypothetical protein [Chloroflexota bacterium]MBP8059378.1 hypothetical protein [Chloroflexota bacterium]